MDERRMAVIVAETLAKQGVNPIRFGSRLFKAMEEVKREGLSSAEGEALIPEHLVGDEEEEPITISNKAMSQICTLAGVEYDVEKQEEGDRRMIFGRPYEYRSGEWSPTDAGPGEEEPSEEEPEAEPMAVEPEEEGPSQAEAEELLDEMDPEEALAMLESGEITEGPALTEEDARSALETAGVNEEFYDVLSDQGMSDEDIANSSPDELEAMNRMYAVGIDEPQAALEYAKELGYSSEELTTLGFSALADLDEQRQKAPESEDMALAGEADAKDIIAGADIEDTSNINMESLESAAQSGEFTTEELTEMVQDGEFDAEGPALTQEDAMLAIELSEIDDPQEAYDKLTEAGYSDEEIANLDPDDIVGMTEADVEIMREEREIGEGTTEEEIDDGEALSQDERDAFVTDAYNEALENGDVNPDDAEDFVDFMNSAPDEQVQAWAAGEENPADTFYGEEPTEAEGVDVGEEIFLPTAEIRDITSDYADELDPDEMEDFEVWMSGVPADKADRLMEQGTLVDQYRQEQEELISENEEIEREMSQKRDAASEQIESEWPNASQEDIQNALEGLGGADLDDIMQGDYSALDETFVNRLNQEMQEGVDQFNEEEDVIPEVSEERFQQEAELADIMDELGFAGAERADMEAEIADMSDEELQQSLENMRGELEAFDEDTSEAPTEAESSQNRINQVLSDEMVDDNQRAANMLTTSEAEEAYDRHANFSEMSSDGELASELLFAHGQFQENPNSENAARFAAYFEEANNRATNP